MSDQDHVLGHTHARRPDLAELIQIYNAGLQSAESNDNTKEQLPPSNF